MNGRKRFIYSANAVGVAAKVPPVEQFWACCSLPVCGGRGSCKDGPFQNSFLSFESAEATAYGGVNTQGQIVSEARTTVTKLNILNRLTAEKIELMLRFTFDQNGQRLISVDITDKPYTRLVIDGQNYDNVSMERNVADEAGKDHGRFRRDLPTLRPNAHHIQQTHHTAYTTLAADPGGRLRSMPQDHGYVDVANFGRVYFGEWSEHLHRQNITGLRVVLDTPTVKGEIVIADPGGNGQFYP